jgi:allantoicase
MSDGGTKRLRIYGYPMSEHYEPHTQQAQFQTLTIPALPLTPEAFKPYGQVIQGHSPAFGAPKGVAVTSANQGTAYKFHRLSNVAETYPEGLLKKGGLHASVIRAFGPQHETEQGVTIDIVVLER